MKKILLATTALVAFSTPVFADPISAAIAATVSMGSAALSFTAFGLSLSGMGAAFAHFAIRAALGYALNALAPKPTGISRGYTVNGLGPALPHAIVYGTTRVGGAIFYQNVSGTNNRYFHRCIALAGHELEEITTVYFNDEAVTLDGSGNVTAPAQYVGFARVKKHLGAADQTADSDLVAEVAEWTTSHRARGVAYLYCRFDYDTTAFPNGLPTVTSVVKGKKVYDRRDGSTAYSENPALCIYDYLAEDFGLGETTDAISSTFETAADVCDEDVSGSPRYTCNGTFTLDSNPGDIIGGLLSSMGGMFWYSQGQWGCKAAKYVAPTVSFNESDARGNIQIATRVSRRDGFNAVTGVYRGPDSNWQETDYPEVTNASYVTEDGGFKSSIDLPLLFTDTEVMAQRIAKIALERNRRQVSVTAPFGLRAIKAGVGDTVQFSNTRAGFSDKVFEVQDWRFALAGDGLDLQVNMLLREIDSGVFT